MASVLAGADLRVVAFLGGAALLLLILPSLRPAPPPIADVLGRAALAIVFLSGALQTGAYLSGRARDCRTVLSDGRPLEVTGFVTEERHGRLTLEVDEGLPRACRVPITVRAPGAGRPLDPGRTYRFSGPWRVSARTTADPRWAGELVATEWSESQDRGERAVVAWRWGAVRRVHESFPGHAPLVSALVLARKDGLDPGIREAFARAGTAHLLAISGFHVAVVAGLLLTLLRRAGLGRRGAAAASAVGVWGYVWFIGAPDAALRAAVLLSLFAAGRVIGRPLHAGGALAAAFLALTWIDPGGLARPGFQLSFAGAAGLVIGAPRLDRTLGRWLPGGGWLAFRSALAAGVAASMATLPIAAWHFDRVSLVGIPATLVATPLVAAAIPGIFLTLMAQLAWPAAGAFLSGGVELLLDVLVTVMERAAALPFATLPVDRAVLSVLSVGLVAGAALSERGLVRRRFQSMILTAGGLAALVVAPVVTAFSSAGSVEIRVLDVGQGDAIAIRSPAGRWILVDAGPGLSDRGGDPRSHPVVRSLRRAGVRGLGAMVLTHPDLDHIGGAAPVIEGLDVAEVMDPGRSRGTGPYVTTLRAAHAEPAIWRTLTKGDILDLDGVSLEVLHPTLETPPDADPNDASVVLWLRFGLFSALLTGDAPSAVEEVLVSLTGPVDVLKVAHHGSRTSSSARFLGRLRPTLSVISVGGRNRYGHPHPEVTARLLRYSGRVLSTDEVGEVRIEARRNGAWQVVTERGDPID